MNIYYIFKIKDEYYDLYKNHTVVLYKILKQIYNLKKNEINYGISIFNQICNEINKKELDNYIYRYLKNKNKYYRNKDEHIINDIFNNEISILKVYNTYIIINSKKTYTEFLDILYRYNYSLFICDFKNNRYFFLSRLKTLV